MNIALLVLMAFYTLLIVAGIHYYENKLRNFEGAIEDYKRALRISNNHSNTDHYAYLQIENKRLKKEINDLSQDNDILQTEIKMLRKDLIEGTYGQYKGYSVGGDIQYESHVYKNKTWDYVDYNQDELDLEQ